jgi:hypothetical protein
MTPLNDSALARPVPVARRPPPRVTGRSASRRSVAERLRARRRRIRQIRTRVVAIATSLFLASSGGILLQLVTGNDPALAKAAAKSAHSTKTSSAGSTSGASGSSTSSGSSSSGSATPVTSSAS